MWKEKILPFLKKYYPFLLLIPLVILALFFVLRVFARDIVVNPGGNPFPKGSEYSNDQIIVKYRKGQSPEELKKDGRLEQEKSLADTLVALGVESQQKLFTSVDDFLKNYYLLYLKQGTNIQDLYKKLSDVPEIDSITPDYILKTDKPDKETTNVPSVQSPPISDEEPNDPYFVDGQQWDMNSIDMKKAWNIKRAGAETVVAVIDTGVDYNHPDLVGKVIKGKNYINNTDDPMDDHGHGTHVAGTIGAITNNGIGISSVSWGAKILAIKACDNNGDCITSNVVRGISYALSQGVKVINISIAGVGSCTRENFFGGDRVYEDVIKEANSKGAIMIVAAGNNNQDAKNEVPGACEGVVAVGATNQSNERWVSSDSTGSNFGDKIDLSAPGSPILSTSVQNGYSIRNGTSMAAPHVSGVAALLLSFNKNLSSSELKKCIVESAGKIESDRYIGGLLNAYNALMRCGASNPQSISALTPTSIPSILPTAPDEIIGGNNIDNYSISGTIFIDQNNNGLFDSSEKTLGGVQVLVSPTDPSTSILANPRGFYFFNDLGRPDDYLVSLVIPGVSAVNLPTRTVTLSNTIKSARINIPVSPLALPSPSPRPTNMAQNGAPSPTSSQNVPQGCYYDPGCFSSNQSVQACSFTCD